MPELTQGPSAAIAWDAQGQPISVQFDDVYFSKNSGIDETRFVFLKHNGLPQRWQQMRDGEVFTIAETGFGTGLNFLAAWQSWRQHAPANASLHFISVEKFPLSRADLARALQLWPELGELAAALLAQYPPVSARGQHRLNFGAVHLTLIYDDATAGFSQLLTIANPGPRCTAASAHPSPYAQGGGNPVDAWFLDGFAPAKNPDLWTADLFHLLARLSRTGTSFATFTAAGIVKRGLAAAGFQVKKVAGYGTKRDMLHGIFDPEQGRNPPVLPGRPPDPAWHLLEPMGPPPTEVAVIGAGLAGCHTAWALAQQGMAVTLVDALAPGAGASGNPVGIVYSRFSHRSGTLADFNLAAYLHACRFYHSSGLFRQHGDPCGVMQLPELPEHASRLRQVATAFDRSPELLRWLEPDDASAQAGVPLRDGALWLPQAGWLNPLQLCHALTQHPNIRLLAGTPVARLQRAGAAWHLISPAAQTLHTSPAVVIACAHSARQFAQSAHLPLKKIRGQISFTSATAPSQELKTVLCGDGYIAPAHNGQHCAGASFVLDTEDAQLSWDEHRQNLAKAAALAPVLGQLEVHDLQHGRVSFRCTTPDYLPVVGPVADAEAMRERFASLRQNAKAPIDQPGVYHPGLFINAGHGSRGLTYTPLCADYLAHLLGARPLPLPRTHLLALHPARFLIRDLGRNKP